jgi:hypothetical protein
LQTDKLFRPIDRVGNQDVVKSRGDHHLGLADFGARNARRARVYLESRNLRHLVGLRMRSKSNAGVAGALGHFGDVVLDNVKVYH